MPWLHGAHDQGAPSKGDGENASPIHGGIGVSGRAGRRCVDVAERTRLGDDARSAAAIARLPATLRGRRHPGRHATPDRAPRDQRRHMDFQSHLRLTELAIFRDQPGCSPESAMSKRTACKVALFSICST